MKNYLVTYDLNKTGQDYDRVISAIKKYPYYSVLKSAWLIRSVGSAASIYETLKGTIDTNDRLMVVEITSNTNGFLNQGAWDFLNQKI